jgi:hypothetical protein
MSRHDVYFAGRSEGYIKMPKIKIKKISPKDFGKALYKFSGVQGMVDTGKALGKCKPKDAKCIASNLGNLALSASSFVPGIGVAGRAASVAKMAVTAAKVGKAAAAAAKAGKAASAIAKAGKGIGKAADVAGGFVGDNAGVLSGGAALLGAGALGAAALRSGEAEMPAAPEFQMPAAAPGFQMPAAAPGFQMPAAAPGFQMPGAPGLPGMPGLPGAPGAPGAPGGSGYLYAPIQMQQPPPTPVKINIQISGKDMAASSGVFGDEEIGVKQPPGRQTVKSPSGGDEEEESGGGAKAALLGFAKNAASKKLASAMSGEGFTLEGAEFKTGLNWFAILFFLICILVIFILR